MQLPPAIFVVGRMQGLVPDGEAFNLLNADYVATIEAGYIEGDAEAFEVRIPR